MRILIIGATRGIGAQLLDQALAADHQVTVLARRPEKISTQAQNLTVLGGDILDLEAVEKAVQGHEAICLTIGVPITFSPVETFSRGTATVVAAMHRHNVRRLICVTGIGAGDTKGHGGFLYDRVFNPLFLKTIYQDKNRQEKLTTRSGFDWVIPRPARLTNGPRTGSYRVITDLSGVTSTSISRADVADFIVRELAEAKFTGTAPLLSY